MPPVQVPQILLPHLQQHLRHVAATTRPFTVRLRGTGTFRPISPVVYAKVVAGIEQCESLQALVRSGPVQRSLDFPYHPHVTIAHGVDESRLDEAQTALENIDETFTVQSLHVSIQGDDGIWRASGAYRFGSLS